MVKAWRNGQRLQKKNYMTMILNKNPEAKPLPDKEALDFLITEIRNDLERVVKRWLQIILSVRIVCRATKFPTLARGCLL